SVHILCLDDCSNTTIMPQPAEITQFIFGQPLRHLRTWPWSRKTRPARAAMGVRIMCRRPATVPIGGAKNKRVDGPKAPQQRGKRRNSTELMRLIAQNAGVRWSHDQDNSAIFMAALIIRHARQPLHPIRHPRKSHQASEETPHPTGKGQVLLEIL